MANVSNILEGVDEVIDQCLKIPSMRKDLHWWHKTTALLISDPPGTTEKSLRRPEQRELEGAVRQLPIRILERMETSCGVPAEPLSSGGSDENWRIEKKTQISVNNRSKEVCAEREGVRRGDHSWVNQIPTCSGFKEGGFLGRCAVDLAHHCGHDRWDLIELKIGSDNPFYAAMEILQYGVLYVFSRLYYPSHHPARDKGLLQENVSEIGLRVLAPEEFYDARLRLGWLKAPLTEGLEDMLKSRCPKGLKKMDFDFCVLNWVPIEKALEDRHPYEWSR